MPHIPLSHEEGRLGAPRRTNSTPADSGVNNGLIAQPMAIILAPDPGGEELQPVTTSSTPSSTVHLVGDVSIITATRGIPPTHNNPSLFLVAITNIPPGTRPHNIAGRSKSPSLPGSPIVRSTSPNRLGQSGAASPSSPYSCDPAVYVNDSRPSTPCGRGTPNGSSQPPTGTILEFPPFGRTISSGADSPMLIDEKEEKEDQGL
ncbi:hypothetical protein [Candidatus Finniella inopinata]|uniref:Uncharacterized protein n=1 Tax=Candidatus Finniella inopinata TaxID=1696036 RepID=A0A4Q7DGG6_9PROT|nr:hypothetical protein [Candidatus Finniella inopinata]RZI45961.1 hypothetical protein EQU50_05890 [Candidatus Finniella inopinata]